MCAVGAARDNPLLRVMMCDEEEDETDTLRWRGLISDVFAEIATGGAADNAEPGLALAARTALAPEPALPPDKPIKDSSVSPSIVPLLMPREVEPIGLEITIFEFEEEAEALLEDDMFLFF